jgi:hypothetical protein
MKHLKILVSSIACAVAIGLISVTGVASATALYSGATKVSQGTLLEATGTNMVYKAGFATIECGHSEVSGKTSTTGGSAQTVELPIGSWNMTECNATWTTLKKGNWIFHWTSGTSGTVTSAGWEWTIAYGGTSCTYGTPNATSLGTLGGTTKAGEAARLLVSASLTRVAGGFLCANPATLTATYTFNNPVPLHVTAS